PGDCGSWHTPTKFFGYSAQTRAMRSLQCCDQWTLVVSSPTWCAMADARGEKIVTSVPRSRWSFNCAPSRLSRISSSVIDTVPLDGGAPDLSAAVWVSRQAWRPFGALV